MITGMFSSTHREECAQVFRASAPSFIAHHDNLRWTIDSIAQSSIWWREPTTSRTVQSCMRGYLLTGPARVKRERFSARVSSLSARVNRGRLITSPRIYFARFFWSFSAHAITSFRCLDRERAARMMPGISPGIGSKSVFKQHFKANIINLYFTSITLHTYIRTV